MADGQEDLLARINRLEADIEALRNDAQTRQHVVDALLQQRAEPSKPALPDAVTRPATSRRRAIGALAASTVGAAVAVSQPHAAAAADGDTVKLGTRNQATTMTEIWAELANSPGSYALDVWGFDGAGLQTDGIIALHAWGSLANAWFHARYAAPTENEAFVPGLLKVEENGNWWVSVAEGQWRQIAGPQFSTVGPQGPAGPAGAAGPAGPQGPAGPAGNTPSATAGSTFKPLNPPVRVYDTRNGQPAPGEKRRFDPSESRVIDLTANGSGVPASATAVQLSYAVISPDAAGYAVAWPSGDRPPVSQVNYAPGWVIGTSIVLGAVNGTVMISSLAACDICVDVYGYFV